MRPTVWLICATDRPVPPVVVRQGADAVHGAADRGRGVRGAAVGRLQRSLPSLRQLRAHGQRRPAGLRPRPLAADFSIAPAEVAEPGGKL